jgi:hypothetical protein
VVEDAKLLTTDKVQLEHLDWFLDNIMEKIRPCHAQLIDSKIGVRWDWGHGYLSILFGSDDKWEWKTESAAVEREKYGVFNRTATFKGAPTFVIKEKPYYSLPDEVEKLITLPDTFEGTYDPIIEKYKREIVWVTSKCDGMLAGYCRYEGKLHLFEHVEETEFTQNRMFAVFELSLLERLRVWWRYHVWYTVLYNRVLWNMHNIKIFKPRYETYDQRLTRLKKTHKIVGYFPYTD